MQGAEVSLRCCAFKVLERKRDFRIRQGKAMQPFLAREKINAAKNVANNATTNASAFANAHTEIMSLEMLHKRLCIHNRAKIP